jgi:large subunit ribosomal protein L22
MKASLYNYRQSPRKVRTVANSVRGKKVSEALSQLSFLPKRAAGPLKKLILSAVSNAKQLQNLEENNLFVKELRVDKGLVMKRSTPRAFGRASRINKRTSHVLIVLDDVKNMKQKKSNKKAKPVAA